MSSTKGKRVLIRDTGNYTFLAERFKRNGYEVLYYVPNDEEAWTIPDRDEIGTGIEGVKRITGEDDFWPIVDDREVDWFYFPDVGEGGLQTHLRNLGFPVYGSGDSQILELDKYLFNDKLLPKIGLPYVPFERIKGTKELEAYLQGKKDLYIKISFHRGVFETLHFVDWDDFEETFLGIEMRLGKRRKTQEFLVQAPIKSDLEIGLDGWNLNGDYPESCMIGIENKDACYIGKIFKSQPPLFRHVNDKIRPAFQKYGYAGSYATEYRIQDKPYSREFRGKPFYTDLTAREPAPPCPVRSEMYSNFPECAEELAHGRMPVPKPSALYAAEMTLLSTQYGEGDDGQWTRVDFPAEIARWVKLKNYCVRNGKYWVIPNHCGEYLGSVVGIGGSIDEAVGKCLKNASQVRANGLHYDTTSFDDVKKQIAVARKMGISL